jgi:hypothetical protein
LLPDDDDSDQKRRKSIKKTASTHWLSARTLSKM